MHNLHKFFQKSPGGRGEDDESDKLFENESKMIEMFEWIWK